MSENRQFGCTQADFDSKKIHVHIKDIGDLDSMRVEYATKEEHWLNVIHAE